MSRLILTLTLAAAAAFAAPAVESAGPPPSEVNPAIAATVSKDGIKIAEGGKVLMEIWFRSTLPTTKNTEDNVTFTNVSQGTLFGVVRFPAKFADRRGQGIAPGVYTMRYSTFPTNGDHQGVAPQRDFLLLTRAADDKDPNATPNFNALVKLSQAASGTPHPLVFSIWKGDAADKPAVEQQGEHDTVLKVKVGAAPVNMIVVGKAEG